MAERLGRLPRPTGMRMRVLGAAFALPLLATACGNDAGDAHLNDLPKSGAATCLGDDQVASSPMVLGADLDGNGEPERVQYSGDSGGCAHVLFAVSGGKRRGVEVTGDLPVDTRGSAAIRIPGRQGVVVMLTQQHPRGGFQARLYGYADGKLAELTVGDNPVFPFVATDAPSDPLAATCVDGGFAVTQARAHTPIGVVPAWDVYRTTYKVAGNAVTKGATTEIADNVLEKDFQATYADLVDHALFESCRVGD